MIICLWLYIMYWIVYYMDVNIKEINKISGDQSILKNCFNSFILPCFEYCSPAWSSAVDFHLKLLDKHLNAIKFLILDRCTKLWHRCSISSLYTQERKRCRCHYFSIARYISKFENSKCENVYHPSIEVCKQSCNWNPWFCIMIRIFLVITIWEKWHRFLWWVYMFSVIRFMIIQSIPCIQIFPICTIYCLMLDMHLIQIVFPFLLWGNTKQFSRSFISSVTRL